MHKIIISVLLIMIPVLFFGYLEKPVEMGIVLFAGFACTVIINIDKFNSFRAGELEATMRHAEEVISEAHATIDQLKSMTVPLMNYSLASIARGDQLMGVNASDKEVLYLELKDNIDKFELQNDYTSQLLEEAKRKIVRTSLFEIEVAVEQIGGSWESVTPLRNVVFNPGFNSKQYVPTSDLREVFTNNPELYNDRIEVLLSEYDRVLNEYRKIPAT